MSSRRSALTLFLLALALGLLALPACVSSTREVTRSAAPAVLAATGSGGVVVVEALEASGRREIGVTSMGQVVLPAGPWAATVRRDLEDELAAALAAGAPTELELDLRRWRDEDPPAPPARVVLTRLARITSLEALVVRGRWDLGPEDLAVLVALPRVRRLVLDVHAVHPGALAALGGLPLLDSLDLTGTARVDSAAWRDLVHLRALRSLRATGRTPDFSWGNSEPIVGDAELALIAASAPRVRDLDLSHADTAITDAGVAWLASLHELERLILDDCRMVGTPGLRALRDLPLRELSLGGEVRGLSEVDDEGLEEIAHHTELRVLRLGDHREHTYPLETRAWRALAKLQALEILDLGELYLEEEGALAISALPLRELSCRLGSEFGPAGAVHLARIPCLERLWIRGTWDQDEPPAFDDAWLSTLAAPGRLVSLELDEVCGFYGDAGLEALAACRRLERLELHAARVGRSGLAAVARLPNLRWLSIRGAFDDAAVRELAHARSLRELSFTSNRITPACLSALAGLGLERVSVGTAGSITSDDVARLAESIPRLPLIGVGLYLPHCEHCTR